MSVLFTLFSPAVGTKPIPTVFFAQNACSIMRMRPRASAVTPVELLESTVVRNGFQAQE
jgi:hypothetical protein